MKTFVSLKTAAEAKGAGVSKETSFKVDPDKIEIEPGFNRPIDPEHVNEIKVAIKGGAVTPPIYVRVEQGRIVMVDGEHRWLAVLALRAEGVTIPHMTAIQFRGNDAERIAHLLTSARGRALSPLEAGLQYLKLTTLNWDVKKIADKTGRSVTHVAECLTLAGADTDVHTAIKNKEVSSTQALEIVKAHGTKAGKVIAENLKTAKDKGKKKVTAKVVSATKAAKEKVKPAIMPGKKEGGVFSANNLNDTTMLSWADSNPTKIKKWAITTMVSGCPLREFIIEEMKKEKK